MAYSLCQTEMTNLAVNRKWAWGVAAFVVAVLATYSLWRTFERAHLMTQVDWATVEMDDHPVPAEVFIGQPTENQAEAFLLVHIPELDDYFLNFSDENYRIATSKEYIRLRRHVWMRKPISDGQFVEPLTPKHLNEFRISSKGHLLRVRFWRYERPCKSGRPIPGASSILAGGHGLDDLSQPRAACRRSFVRRGREIGDDSTMMLFSQVLVVIPPTLTCR
jgi:hypothetical protein